GRVEGRLGRRELRDGVPDQVEARQLNAVFYLLAYLALEVRLRRVRSCYRFALRHGAEIFFDETARLRRVEVARDDEARVIGHVVVPEEVLHVVERGGGEGFHRADGSP